MNFEPVQSDGRLRISEDGQVLKVPEARKEDEGFYECHVTNGIGDPLRKSVRVEVQGEFYIILQIRGVFVRSLLHSSHFQNRHL